MKLLIVLSIVGAGVLGCPETSRCGGGCSPSKCEYCWNSYLANDVCTPITKTVENCVVYALDGLCSVCNLGYRPNGLTGCVAITIGNCLVEKDNQCQMCLKSNLIDNRCVENCSVENCLGCDGVDSCYFCTTGYSQKKNKCIKNTAVNEKCIRLNEKDECIWCNIGYHLDKTKCVKTPGISVTKEFLEQPTTPNITKKPDVKSAFALSIGVLGLVAVSLV